jgi:hypothetical protein
VSGGTGGGSKGAGAWAERRGRGSRRLTRVRARWSTAGAGTAELTGKAHGAEREKGARGNGSASGRAAPRDGEGRGARGGENNWRRQVGPTGQREGGGKHAGQKPPLTGGAHLSGGAGARARWAELGRLGCFAFFFFSGFSNCFSISFL